MAVESLFASATQKELKQSSHFGMQGLVAMGHLNNINGAARLLNRIKEGWVGQRSLSANDQDLMAVINGEHARQLGNKAEFPHLVREIGYKAPDSKLVRFEANETVKETELEQYFRNKPYRLFAKPLNGSWQRNLLGLDVGLTLQEIKDRVCIMNEDYLVQEYLPTKKENEWRYIRYKSTNGTTYAACFQYGHDTTERPIHVPFIGAKLMSAQGISVDEVLTAANEHVPVVFSNDKGQFNRLSAFIEQFVHDLETRLGGEIPFLSMDVGLFDPTILDSNVSLDEMKQQIVFYETQTTPQPWQLKQHSDMPNTRESYFNLWKLMFKERSSNILSRALTILK